MGKHISPVFRHHVSHFNASQHGASAIYCLEAEHRSYRQLNRAVILLNEVVQILALPDPD